jgi:hypothetical protein
MNIYIKYYITMLSHMLSYYIYPCHTQGWGGDGDELTYSSLPLEGLQWVSILEFRSFKVNFIFCRFFIYKKF